MFRSFIKRFHLLFLAIIRENIFYFLIFNLIISKQLLKLICTLFVTKYLGGNHVYDCTLFQT